MIDKPWFWSAVIIGSALVAVVTTLIGWEHPIRTALVLWFVCVGPGLGVLDPLELGDATTGLLLVVPLSLAIDALVATVLVYLGLWSSTLALIVVAAVTVAALTAGRRYIRPAPQGPRTETAADA